MSVRQFQDNMLFDFDAIKAQCQPPPKSPAPIAGNKDKFASTERTRHMRRHISPKIVTGPPKSLCLSRLHGLDDIASVLITRQGSPCDVSASHHTYEVAGEVMSASGRTRPSRVVAIRKHRKQDSRRLIDSFGRLEHVNILLFHECYIHTHTQFITPGGIRPRGHLYAI
jgi:hypothetical protein